MLKIATNDTENFDVVRRNVAAIVCEASKSNADLTTELLTAYDRESKLLGGIRRRDKEIARLKSEVAKRDNKLASMTERLERLLESKAMRVQRAYWKLRRPNGSRPSDSGSRLEGAGK